MKIKTSRIIFFGTPDFAVPSLQALIENGYEVPLVVTQPDKPTGRGKKMASPPIKVYCDQQNLHCIQPKRVKNNEFVEALRSQNADLFVVAAFGRLLSQKILDLVPLTLNVHASILPRWRGASPIAQSILHGDSETGVSMMKIVQELDAGPVMLQKKIPIDSMDDTEQLTQKLSQVGGQALIESLQLLNHGKADFVEQDSKKATFAPMLNVEDAKIDWNANAINIQRHIRAYSPNPGAHTFDGTERIKIFKSRVLSENAFGKPGTLSRKKKQLMINCKDHMLEILEVQRPGKTRQGIVDFLNGYSPEQTQWT